MSDSSAANTNNWTILTPEEAVAETLRPVEEVTEHHEDTPSNAATLEPPGDKAESRPEKDAVSVEESHPVEALQVPQETEQERSKNTIPVTEGTIPDSVHDPNLTADLAHDPNLTPVPNPILPSDDPPPDPDILSQPTGFPESPAPPSPDPDSFSDSYTHISPSPEEPPVSLRTTETLGEEGLIPEQEELIQEGVVHQFNGEGILPEEEEPELSQRVTVLGKQADSQEDSVVGEERGEEKGEEGESEVRRRRVSLLAALERIGRKDEEEDGEEEEFRLPQKEEESGFSLNKCILGAVILLGLGTIFFSGVFMDLDEEGDYDVRELKDAEVQGKQEWLNAEVPPLPPVDTDSTELLNKLAKENQQIAVLQAQLQAQKEELKVAQRQAVEGGKERLRREEVEMENDRLKKEMTSLPVLQKDNEKMKTELKSVPALQKELETLRATVTELTLTTANEAAPPPVSPTVLPSSGQAGDNSQDTTGPTKAGGKKPWEGEKVEKKKNEWKKEKTDQGEQGKGWKEKAEKKELKEGGGKDWKAEKEWKKGKQDQGKEGKGRKEKEEKKVEWKKEKHSRGDEGKPWKNREENKEWKDMGGRKEGKEEKEWKKKDGKKDSGKEWKGKYARCDDGKDWKGKGEKKMKKGGKDNGGWNKGKDEWRGEKEWGKGKDDHKEGGKEWKEKAETKEWKGEKQWKKKDGKKDSGKEREGKEEKKHWEGNEKQWSKEGERKKEGWKGERKDGDWKKDKGSYHKDGQKSDRYEKNHNHFKGGQKEKERGKKEKLWQGPGDKSLPQTHQQPPLEQPDYWVHQRERLQHKQKPNPSTHCSSVETCAQAEGLLPVPMPDFEALLQGYLAKAEGVGVEASRREELSKLAKEFFRDGVFAHDQMSFQDFVEDVEDILEDMVEGEGTEEMEDEMDGFEEEAMEMFGVPGAGEKEERKKGELKKESGRGRG